MINIQSTNQVECHTEMCLLSNRIGDYYYISQGKTRIPGVNDASDMEDTEVSPHNVQKACFLDPIIEKFNFKKNWLHQSIARKISYGNDYKHALCHFNTPRATPTLLLDVSSVKNVFSDSSGSNGGTWACDKANPSEIYSAFEWCSWISTIFSSFGYTPENILNFWKTLVFFCGISNNQLMGKF